MWLALLRRFWQPLVALAAAGVIWWAVDDYGDRREAAANARWQARYAEAERRAAERTRALESAAAAISAEWERRYAEQTQTLTARYADVDRRMRALSVRLAAAGACRDNLPEVAGASGGADAAPAGERRADEAGGRIAAVGRDCESDATRLSALQQWIREQRAILMRHRG